MFAKVVVICAVLAAVHAGGYGGVGLGNSYISVGAPNLIADVGHSSTSSQSAVINHIAPAVSKIAMATTNLGHGGILSGGLISGGLLGGLGSTASYGGAMSNGILGTSLIGKAIVSAPSTVSSQSTVINHVAPASTIGHSGIISGGMITGGLLGGIGNMGNGYGGIENMAIGNIAVGYGGIGNSATGYGAGMSDGLIAAPMVGKATVSAPAAVSSQSTVIEHVAPAITSAPMGHSGILSTGFLGGLGNNALNYGGLAGHGMIAPTGSSYLAPSTIAVSAPVTTKYAIAAPATITSQTTMVSRAAPKIAVAPVTLSTGLIGNGIWHWKSGYGIGNGIGSTHLNTGLLGGYNGGSLGMGIGKMY